MLELTDWARTQPFGPDAKPWLLLGKGPTFARFDEVDTSGFLRITLNHVVQRVDTDIAHLVDLDVLADCADRLLSSARFVVMPRYPHFETGPQELPLEGLFERFPVLAELDRQGRLIWYNLEYSAPVGGAPVLTLRSFASEPAMQILGRLGVKTVRTLGIDGGIHYSAAFDANAATRLVNGVPSFDEQFVYLRAIAAEYGIDFGPIVSPLRIFVGADESQVVAARVLEHTIRANTSWPVEVTYLHTLDLPKPLDPKNRGGTGFSYARFAIPQLCNFNGRAVYLDADMQVFGDIAELAEAPLDGHAVLCTNQQVLPSFSYGFTAGRQLSVMVLDCSKLDWDVNAIVARLDAEEFTYQELLHDLCIVDGSLISESLPEEWNHLERYLPGQTKLLHYTNAPTQPWRSRENSLRAIWMSAYHDAVRAGAVPPEEVEGGIASGHLLYELTSVLAEAPTRRASVSNALTDARTATVRANRLEADLLRAREEYAALQEELESVRASESYRFARVLADSKARVGRALRALRRGRSRTRYGHGA
ncbi:MAG: hypothetical protein QOF21_1202 [Actinomycetota bacterium]|jgi:hypothetical protein